MSFGPPASLGMKIADVDTPALLLDLDAFENNVRCAAAQTASRSIRLRPHAKSHKCPEIARRQIAAGAVGICCQKVSEAEVFAEGGIYDILITNEVVGRVKLERLARLAKQARIGVCVDHPGNLLALQEAASALAVSLDVYIEVNVGADRCGVEPGDPVAELARVMARCSHLRFAGLQAYQGKAQHLRTSSERKSAMAKVADKLNVTAAAMRAADLQMGIVTGGGTGTWLIDRGDELYDELQLGSYIFMDADYGRNLGEDGSPEQEFQQSLFLLATVMSSPHPHRAIVDVGLKAVSTDSGMPLVAGAHGIVFTKAADEHGTLSLEPGVTLKLGEKLKLVPGHCDPTVNLHDWMVAYRKDTVEAVWPISARGAFF